MEEESQNPITKKDAAIKAEKTYQVGNFDELLKRHNIPPEAINMLYGKDRPNISCLELDEADLITLDKNQAVRRRSRNDVGPYRNMVAFTMAPQHEVLLGAMKMALEIKEDIQLPLVVIKKGASVVPIAHEFTHAVKRKIYIVAGSLHDYIHSPEEREAFLNSILIYRLISPAGSFFDFAREQENVTKEEFPDKKIEGRIADGEGKYLGLQQQMWNLIDKQIGQGRVIEVNDLPIIKQVTQEQIESREPEPESRKQEQG